jgi:uncharacterized protein (TIGR02118 family)
MFKTVRLAKFRPELSLDQGSRHWTEVHGPLGLAVPGLIGYVQNHCICSIDSIVNATARTKRDERPLFDGFACEWHHDETAFVKDVTSAEWKKCVEDADLLFDRTSMRYMSALVEPRVVREGPRGNFKVAMFFRFKPGLSRDEASDHWLNVHGELVKKVPGMGRNVQNLVVSAIGGKGLSDEPVNFDGFVEMWFADRATFDKAVVSPEWVNDLRSDGDILLDRESMKGMGAVVDERIIREEPRH